MRRALTNLKRIVAVLVVLCLMFSLIPANTLAFQATDISGHWAQVKIQSWIDKGLIKGYPDGTFKPDQDITRAEFMALVNRAFGYTAVAPITYTDVKAGSWYAPEVAKAQAAGYITGYPDGTMKPENPITREEVATIVARIKNLTSDANAADKYTDAAKIGSWSKGQVGAVTSAKIMQGYPDGSFMPQGLITRAEVVVALDNALHYTAPVVVTPPVVTPPVVTPPVVTPPVVTPPVVTPPVVTYPGNTYPVTTYPVTFTVADGVYAIDGASVTIASQTIATDVYGKAIFDLADGTYSYDVTKTGYGAITDGSATVAGAAVAVPVTMTATAAPLTVVRPITSADVAVTQGSIDFLFSFVSGSTPITFAQAQADLYCLDTIYSTVQLRAGSNDSSPVSSEVRLSDLPISDVGKLSYATFESMVAAFGSFQHIPTDIRLSLSCGVDPTISNLWTYDTGWIHFSPEEQNVFALYGDVYSLLIKNSSGVPISGDALASITNKLTLDSTGTFGGSTITWASSNTSVIANDGTVTRPASGTGNATVTLTATITKGTLSPETKVFTLTVLAETAPTYAQTLAAAKTTAHGVLTTALGTYTQGNYTTDNWATLTGFKTAGDTAIDAATDLTGVTAAQDAATAGMAGVATIAGTEEAADAAVTTAEGSNLQADVTTAHTLVTALPDGAAKTALQGRIDAVQAIVNATAAVEAAEATPTQGNTIDAATLVTALPDGAAKTALQGRIDAVQAIVNATAAVEAAEATPTQGNTIDAATLVTALPDGAAKTALQGRIDAVQGIIDATAALTDKIAAVATAESGKTEGTAYGNTIVGSKATLDAAKAVAAGVLAAAATKSQAELDAATSTLDAAITAYNAAVVGAGNTTDLLAAIVAAQSLHGGAVEGTAVGEYAAGSKATLLAAIGAAQEVVASETATSAEVTAAEETLAEAVSAFETGEVLAGDTTQLVSDIEAAQSLYGGAVEGTAVGEYAAGSKATLLAAIEAAQEVVDSGTATAAEVTSAEGTLAEAVSAFEAGEVLATIAQQFPDENLASGIASWLGSNVDDYITKDIIADYIANGNYELDLYGLGISNMTGFEIFNGTNLEHLGLAENNLTSVDVSGLTHLTNLGLRDNPLTTLDVSDLANLEALNVSNTLLSSLDVSGLINLEILKVFNTQLSSLDVSGLINLEVLYASPLTSADIIGLDELNLVDTDFSDTTDLVTAIEAAQSLYGGAVEGTAVGEYAAGSKATLLAAIEAAQEVVAQVDPAATAAEVTSAEGTLAEAVSAFETGEVLAGDTTQLVSDIEAAQSLYGGAVEGTAVGEYAAGSKATLLAAIEAAQEVVAQVDPAATAAEVTSAEGTLAEAVSAFETGEVLTLSVGAGKTYTTIQAAVDAAQTGNTINVAAGTYTENLTVGKSLTLKGVGDGTIINGAIVAAGDSVTIQDLKITTPGLVNYDDWYYGVRATANHTLTLENVTIDVSGTNIDFYGVRMGFEEASTSAVINISDSRIKGYAAIYLNGSPEGQTIVQTGTVVNVHDTALLGTTQYSGSTSDFAVIAIDNTTGVTINFTGTSSVVNEYTNGAQAKERLIRFRNASGTSVTGMPTYTNAANSTVNAGALFMSYGNSTNTVNGQVVARWITNTAEFETELAFTATTPIVVARYETDSIGVPIQTTVDTTLGSGVTLIIEEYNHVIIGAGHTFTNYGTIVIEPNVTFTGTIETTIDIAAVPGVTAPVKNANAVTTITETTQYTGTVTWSPPSNNPFWAATAYTATITLTPKTGYTLTGVAADFFTVADATSHTNPAGSGVVTAVFPATGAVEIGDHYQGGIVAYIFQPGDPGYISGEVHGLIAATGDQSTGIIWAISTYDDTSVVGTLTTLGSGSANTDKIIDQNVGGGTTYAAGLARAYNGGGYDDWYLPSLVELNKLRVNQVAIGGFTTGVLYWSSSEYPDNIIDALSQDFGSEFPNAPLKSDARYVRAVRTF